MSLKILKYALSVVLLSVFLLPISVRAISKDIFISEVFYDTTGSCPQFIELYNKTQESLDISGWIIEIFDGSMDQITLPDEAVIPGYGFYLIGRTTDSGEWSGCTYEPDFYADSALDFYSDKGAVELNDKFNFVKDKVGWGECSFNYCEGSPFALPEEGHSLERKSGPTHNEIGGNAYDTDDNSVNFRDRPVPEPQNITSIPEKPQLNVEGFAWGYIKAMYTGEK